MDEGNDEARDRVLVLLGQLLGCRLLGMDERCVEKDPDREASEDDVKSIHEGCPPPEAVDSSTKTRLSQVDPHGKARSSD